MSDYVELYEQPEMRLRLIDENVRDYAIFTVDPEGYIASWNLGAERILGYARAEAIGMNCAQIFTPEDRQNGAVDKERNTAREVGRAVDERWHLRKDETRFWGSEIMTALKDDEGNLCGYVKILRDETRRKQAEEELTREHERRVLRERHNAVLEERNRMAHEIHDTLAQNFTAINLQLEAMRVGLPEEAHHILERVNKAQEIARQGIAEARRSVWALRPELLDGSNFAAALTRIAEETQAIAPLTVNCAIEGTPDGLPPGVEDQLLRITQEAITNVLRHAHATELHIRFHADGETTVLQVRDNGVGFNLKDSHPGFGLTSMRERGESLGGEWTITSEPGSGAQIELRLPF